MAALTDAECASPLPKSPSDLRHAAVSLWLNAGVPPTQVTEWAGPSVNVLPGVNAECVHGHDEVARIRSEAAVVLMTAAEQPRGPWLPPVFLTNSRKQLV